MDVRGPLSAPEIFLSLSKSPEVSETTRGKLIFLGSESTALFSHLQQENIDNDVVLSSICTITSEWRTLIRENNEAIGSDFNRLKLFHAFENILDKVKVTVKQQQGLVKAKAEENARAAKQNQGWLSWAAEGVVKGVAWTAATTASVSVGVLNKAVNYVMPESYQNWINDTKDQFIDYSMKLLEGENGSVTFEHILEGIENWQKFVNEAHRPEETDVRITQLKQQVAEQLNTSPTIQEKSENARFSPEQMAEMREFIKQAEFRHQELADLASELDLDPIEIFAEGRDLLLSEEIEGSILERGQSAVRGSLASGMDVMTALKEGIQVSVAGSLNEIATIGIAEFTRSRVSQGIEAINERYQKAVKTVNQRAEELVIAISQRVSDGNQNILEEANRVTKQIWSQAEAVIGTLTQKFTDAQNALQDFAVRKKNEYIENNYTPEAIMQDSTFTNVIDDWVWYWLPTNVRPHTKELEETLTVGLQTNLVTVLQEDNLQRVGVAAIKATENILHALHNAEGKSPEQILANLREIEGLNPFGKNSAALQETPLTLEAYKERVRDNVAERLGRLAVSPPTGEGMFNEMEKKFYHFKLAIMGLMIKLVFKYQFDLVDYLSSLSKGDPNAEEALKNAKGNGKADVRSNLSGFLSGIVKNFALKKVGLDVILKEFSQQSDISFYYMLDKITEEIDDIVTGKGSSPLQEEDQKASPLKKAVHEFTNPQNPIIPAALKVQLGPFMHVLEKQGDARSIKDVTTPIVQSLLPKWRNWVAGKEP